MEDEINLMDYIRVINKRRNLIIIFVIIASAIAFINTLHIPKMYKAEVTFLSMSSGMGGLAQSLSSLGFGIGGGQGENLNIEAILKSRALAMAIAEEQSDLRQIIFKDRQAGNEPTLDQIASAIQSSMIKGSVTKIEVQSNDPYIAAAVANAYAKGLIRFLNQKSIGMNLQVLDEAVPPKAPFNKKSRDNTIIGAIVGLFIGVFLAFFMEYWDKIRSQLKSI